MCYKQTVDDFFFLSIIESKARFDGGILYILRIFSFQFILSSLASLHPRKFRHKERTNLLNTVAKIESTKMLTKVRNGWQTVIWCTQNKIFADCNLVVVWVKWSPATHNISNGIHLRSPISLSLRIPISASLNRSSNNKNKLKLNRRNNGMKDKRACDDEKNTSQ